jgi:predicted ABC-type ATPase
MPELLMIDHHRILILAGPNGAGKTTFAREYLIHEADCPTFINADLIADGLSPFAPERAALRAGRIMLELMADAVKRKANFAFETTLAGRNYARHIPEWRALGYFVKLHFLSLPSADVAVSRVAERVRQGGHAVPEDVIRRRFTLGWENFQTLYRPLVDSWILYDCGGQAPSILNRGENP